MKAAQPLSNPKWERFAVAIAMLGMAQAEAYRDAGFSAKSCETNAARLSKRELVASRINYLVQQRASKHVLKHDISRERVLNELRDIAFAPETTKRDKLGALKMISDLEGYAAPARRETVHAHLQVNASTLALLRAGFAELHDGTQATRLLSEAKDPLPVPPQLRPSGAIDTSAPHPSPTAIAPIST
jgi:hypothetical protein